MTAAAVHPPAGDRAASASLELLQDRWCSRRTLDNPLRRWLAPAHLEVDRLAPAEGATVIDLGVGAGYYVPELLRQVGENGRLWIVDPDPKNLRHAAERAAGDARVTARVGSAAHLTGIPENAVDRALLSLVLCCLVEKEAAMDEVWRILRPGGRALVTYPDRRVRLRRSSRSLRMTAERWEKIRIRHAWRSLPVEDGWVIRRHLVEKPMESSIPSA